jgi:hypothetical protein
MDLAVEQKRDLVLKNTVLVVVRHIVLNVGKNLCLI